MAIEFGTEMKISVSMCAVRGNLHTQNFMPVVASWPGSCATVVEVLDQVYFRECRACFYVSFLISNLAYTLLASYISTLTFGPLLTAVFNC